MFKETAKSSGIPFAEVVVLGLLAEKPCYGYEIDSEIKARGLNQWGHIAFSSIYYLLGKLEKQGYVTFHHHKEGKYPTRKVYSLTESGRVFLKEGLLTLLTPDESREVCIMGAAFIHVLEKEVALKALRQQLDGFNKHAQKIKGHFVKMTKVYPFPNAVALASLAERMHSTITTWLSEFIDTLEDYPWENWQKVSEREVNDCVSCDEEEEDV